MPKKKKKSKKFYKKTQKKVEKKQLPKNSRSFTEKFINDHTVFIFGITIIVAAIIVVGIEFAGNLQAQQIVSEERQEVISELNYWNKQVIEKPNYRDAYFNLALLYYQLGDLGNSKDNLDKAMRLDPSFEKGTQLMNIIGEN